MTELKTETIGKFLGELASDRPTPGGGSVAALSGALAASLGEMVCAIAEKREHKDELVHLSQRMRGLREAFLDLAQTDAAAFDAVMNAYRVPKNDPARHDIIEGALVGAAAIPLRTAETCASLLHGLNELVSYATPQSVSDVGVGVHLADAALAAAVLNVRINLAYMHDRARIASYATRIDQLYAVGKRSAAAGKAAVAERLP